MAFMYADKAPKIVEKKSEVVDFFNSGMKYYEKNNISKTDYEILSTEQLSESITICKVIWTNYDTDGKEAGKEANCYILSGNGKDLKIISLIPMTK